MLDSKARKFVEAPIKAGAVICDKLKLLPNHVTTISFGVGLLAALIYILGQPIIGVIVLWFSGYLDSVDGQLARLSGKSSKAGAFIDMIFDRMVEAFFVLALVVVDESLAIVVIFFLISVIFNFSTFLAAGALVDNDGIKSMHYDVGLMERTETFIFISLAAVLPSYSLYILGVMVVLIVGTGIKRFIKIYHLLQSQEQ